MQLTTMKENFCPVISEVAEYARIGFEKLDGAVEALRTCIADPILVEVEQPFFVAPKHLDYFFY